MEHFAFFWGAEYWEMHAVLGYFVCMFGKSVLMAIDLELAGFGYYFMPAFILKIWTIRENNEQVPSLLKSRGHFPISPKNQKI